jgi:hypothetical protein
MIVWKIDDEVLGEFPSIAIYVGLMAQYSYCASILLMLMLY